MNVPWRDIVVNHELHAHIRSTVDSDRAAVVVVVAGDIAQSPSLLAALQALDASAPPRLGVLIASDDDRAAQVFVPTLAAGGHLVEVFSHSRLDAFVSTLGTFAERLRSERVQSDAPVSRIVDPIVQHSAEAAGIPITTRPNLAGPGESTP